MKFIFNAFKYFVFAISIINVFVYKILYPNAILNGYFNKLYYSPNTIYIYILGAILLAHFSIRITKPLQIKPHWQFSSRNIFFLHKIINKLFSSIGIVEINIEIAKLGGLFINKYRKNYKFEIADFLVAASAKLNNLLFWTLNKKHYPMFKKEELN